MARTQKTRDPTKKSTRKVESGTSFKRDISRLKKIVRVLKKYPGGLWIREISRQSGLHFEQVRRLIERYPDILTEYADFTSHNINLKIIRLANDRITPENVEQYVRISRGM